MKTEAIKLQIIDNYKQLSQLAKVEQTEKHLLPICGLTYKQNGTHGHINQIGMIQRNRAKIQILDGEIKLKDKPFYLTWKRTLKNINKMLVDTIQNINNSEIVTEKVINLLTFPENAIQKLSKAAKR